MKLPPENVSHPLMKHLSQKKNLSPKLLPIGNGNPPSLSFYSSKNISPQKLQRKHPPQKDDLLLKET